MIFLMVLFAPTFGPLSNFTSVKNEWCRRKEGMESCRFKI